APRPTTFVSATRLTASISAADVKFQNRFQVTVRNPDGQASNAITFFITLKPTPAPTLTALTPSTATAGSPGFTLTADGTNFAPGATVLWNGASRTTTFVSASRVTASIPASDIAAAGSASVAVRNPDLTVSNSRTFAIAEPPPLVVRFDS